MGEFSINLSGSSMAFSSKYRDVKDNVESCMRNRIKSVIDIGVLRIIGGGKVFRINTSAAFLDLGFQKPAFSESPELMFFWWTARIGGAQAVPN